MVTLVGILAEDNDRFHALNYHVSCNHGTSMHVCCVVTKRSTKRGSSIYCTYSDAVVAASRSSEAHHCRFTVWCTLLVSHDLSFHLRLK